jgi:hypothetical protein
MKVFIGNTFVGVAVVILLGALFEIFRMFAGLYSLHGFIGLMISLIAIPITLLAAPVYFALEHGMSEFIWQIWVFPAIAAFLMAKGYSLADDNISIGKAALGAILGLIGLGFVAGLIQ